MSIDLPSRDTDVSGELGALYESLARADLAPLWNITDQLLTPTPRPKAVPWLWSATTLRPLAERAIALVPIERGGERRVLSLVNPGLGGRPYAAGTLWGALQCLGPRESAPAHRHSPGAIRFVLSGAGVWTTVDGDACDMAPGDLVLTPAYNWHDHTNGGDEAMLWFDGLDLPVVEALDAVFFEEYGELQQPHLRPHNRSETEYGATGYRTVPDAVTEQLDPTPSPLLVYRWAQTDAELARLAAETDSAKVTIEFTNPRSGASVLPTLGCFMHRIAPNGSSLPERQAGNQVFVVFDGSGHSVIDGELFEWSAGDCFVVPSWAPVEHHARERADLFSISDAPVLRALGLFRRQTLDAAQPVLRVFQPR
ncbi:cupin domain-containing protein [Micromonospora sp. NBC_01699]|uniref:cupin domain-containing protein n=1 Tax=Micromonospora sp. NBC_01699 TaxID=2975984 RepID=UPI002E368B34|nr:cupin domain-containing protein [Micromonospora sp. NBC_01699]